MSVIERESEESWNQWVSSLERFMDGAEGFLYGAYRVARWPFAGLWGLGRRLLQWAKILGEPEASPAPLTHLVVDFRGRWYTGTSLMNRFESSRRLYQWLRSWYCLGGERLKRWYGEDYHFDEVTFQGRLHGNTAYYLFDRVEALKAHRLPGYHVTDDAYPKLPTLNALFRVHFNGDYDLESIRGLGLVVHEKWYKHYPVTVTPNDSGSEPAHSRWYSIPLADRVGMLKLLQGIALNGYLLNELSWQDNRFPVTDPDKSMLDDDLAALLPIIDEVGGYFQQFKEMIKCVLDLEDDSMGLLGLGHEGSCQPHTTSFWYRVGHDRTLDNISVKNRSEKLAQIVRSNCEESGSMENDASRALWSEFESAQAQRAVVNAFWEQQIQGEESKGEFERTHTGFWGFLQDLFGLVRLQPKSPEGVSPEDIQGQVGEPGDSGVDDGMPPASGPDSSESTAVFSEQPQRPPCEPAATSESGVRDITPLSDLVTG